MGSVFLVVVGCVDSVCGDVFVVSQGGSGVVIGEVVVCGCVWL